jgi:hypothetical protein
LRQPCQAGQCARQHAGGHPAGGAPADDRNPLQAIVAHEIEWAVNNYSLFHYYQIRPLQIKAKAAA